MKLNILNICSGAGFPTGLATAQTVLFIARALTAAGASVTVLHCGPHPYLNSVSRKGRHQGIPFRYLGPTTSRPASFILRLAVYALASAELALRLSFTRFAQRSETTVVCLHAQGDLLNAYVEILCMVLRLPIVLETCEWIPEIPESWAINQWIHRHIMFQLCSGVVVISKTIQDRIKSLPAYKSNPFPIYKRSVFVDPSEYVAATETQEHDRQVIAWCGDATTYIKDVLFLVSVAARLAEAHNIVLEIVGPVSNDARHSIETHSRNLGLPAATLRLRGYVTRNEMLVTCRNASVLVQPLWDDVRSKARVPNKLGEYLMSGAPVVTCAVGEVAEYLTDSIDVLFYKEGDAADCARAVSALLGDKLKAKCIGLAGRKFAERAFSYSVHGDALFSLFADAAARAACGRFWTGRRGGGSGHDRVSPAS